MAEVRCKRCRETAEGLASAPLPGAPGESVLAQICRSCWEIWRGEQIKLINEHKLSPAKPEDYAFLVEKMKDYLSLSD